MSDLNSYEKDGWVIVNETKLDGSCGSPGSVDDIASLSDDEDNWDFGSHSGANHNQRRAGSNATSSTRRLEPSSYGKTVANNARIGI